MNIDISSHHDQVNSLFRKLDQTVTEQLPLLPSPYSEREGFQLPQTHHLYYVCGCGDSLTSEKKVKP